MTSTNEITTAGENALDLTDANPLNPNSADPVSAIANTPDHDSRQARYPAWFHDLLRHLRHYRPWRFLIKSDHTIDLEYLTLLALQAQQRAARPYSPVQQLSLFPPPDEVISVTAHSVRTDENPRLTSFTVITGSNRPDIQNAITLPDDILTIKPGEQLHQYLRRVADAAVDAAIETYGSQQAAFARLGSKAHTLTPARPVLTLAPTPIATKTRDRKARP